MYVIVSNRRVCITLQRSVLGGNELMFFADICAGPGGFTEYMLYRTKWHAKGYGFTLKSEQSCVHVHTYIHSFTLMNLILMWQVAICIHKWNMIVLTYNV